MFEYSMIWMLPTTDRRSVRTLEYVTIAALIASVIAVTAVGTQLSTLFTTISTTV